MSALSIFLDPGGVINDKDRQSSQWHALVGECFVDLRGGMCETWTVAHQVVTARLEKWEEVHAQISVDFISFYRGYQLLWIRGMCELVGMLAPAEEECITLAYRVIGSITRRVRAALPGAAEAIRVLHHQGYPLHSRIPRWTAYLVLEVWLNYRRSSIKDVQIPGLPGSGGGRRGVAGAR